VIRITKPLLISLTLVCLLVCSVMSESRDVYERTISELKSTDSGVRQRAAFALGEMGEPNAVEPLIVCFKDSYSYECIQVADALVKIGKPAVEPLIGCLKNDNPDVRANAARALGCLGDQRSVEALIICLMDQKSNVRRNTAEALEKLKWEPPNEQIGIAYLIAKRDWRSVEILGKISVKPLIACLNDEDWNVRCSSAKLLGELHDPSAVVPLIAALKDKISDVRKSSAEALGNLGDLNAVDPLVVSLKDENWQVQQKTIEALGKLGDRRAIEALSSMLPEWFMDEKIGEALERLGWKPKTDKEIVYFWICKNDKNNLNQNWSLVKEILMEDLLSREKSKIEKAAFTVIRLGKDEMVNDLIKAIEYEENAGMATVYLNCGNGRLEQAARDWAKRHNYMITTVPSTTEFVWGCKR
jgi:HEAT repeat protein